MVAGDGQLTPGIANDLLMACDDIGMGRVQRPDLLGKYSRLGRWEERREQEEVESEGRTE